MSGGARGRGGAAPAAARVRRSLVATTAAAVLAVAPAAANASDLTGEASASGARDTNAGASNSYFQQSYWAQYARSVTSALGYRLYVRYQEQQGTATVPGGISNDLRSASFSPLATLDYHLDDFGLGFLYSVDRSGGQEIGTHTLRWSGIQRLSAASYLKPLDGLEARLSAERLAYAGGSSTDNTDDRASLRFQLQRRGLRVEEDNFVQRFHDGATGLSRTSLGPRLGLQYSRQLGNGWTLSSMYRGEYARTEQEVVGGLPGEVAVEVPAVVGLWVNTGLPLDTSSTPMVSDPALIDRSFADSAGIPLGPGGASFQNLGVDMGRFVQLDELRIHVRNAAGTPVPDGGPVTWTMYSSADGLQWAPIDGASSLFDPVMSAYVVRFPAASSRFFKAVNFGVNTLETFVTELQVFSTEMVGPGGPQISSSILQALALALSGRPLPKLGIRYSGQGSLNGASAYGTPRFWTSDFFNRLEGEIGPFGAFSVTVAQTYGVAKQPAGRSQSSADSSAQLRFRPLASLETSLGARQTLTRVNGVSATTRGVGLSQHAAPYESVSLSAAAMYNQQTLAAGGTTDYVSGSGGGSLRLTEALRLEAAASLQRTTQRVGDTSASAATPQLRVVDYQQYSGSLMYNPVATLLLSASLGWISSAAGDGLTQSFRGTWSPFDGGAVQLSMDYAEDVDPYTGDRLRRITLFPRWSINRHAALEMSYVALRGGSAAAPVDQTSMFVTLRVSI